MTDSNRDYPVQHIGSTIMVVMMQVDPADAAEFNAGMMRNICGSGWKFPATSAPAGSSCKRGRRGC